MKLSQKDKRIINEDIADLKFILKATTDKQTKAEIEKEIQRLKERRKK